MPPVLPAAVLVLLVAFSGCVTVAREAVLVQDAALAIPPGGYAHVWWATKEAAVHVYDVNAGNSTVGVCFVPGGALGAVERGETVAGVACHEAVRSAKDTAELPGGHWALVLRCRNAEEPCVVSRTVAVRPL